MEKGRVPTESDASFPLVYSGSWVHQLCLVWGLFFFFVWIRLNVMWRAVGKHTEQVMLLYDVEFFILLFRRFFQNCSPRCWVFSGGCWLHWLSLSIEGSCGTLQNGPRIGSKSSMSCSALAEVLCIPAPKTCDIKQDECSAFSGGVWKQSGWPVVFLSKIFWMI